MNGDRTRSAIRGWLTACAVLTAAMILLGGLTRLTRAGLSITTWDPVMGALPPLDHGAWEHAFELYRSSPEGRLRADAMDLGAFQHIYWIEWAHRLLGRALAVVLFGPLVVFAARRSLPRTVTLRLGLVFVAGGVQALLGWLMVQSGLVDAPHVSPYRLAGHFTLGVALFVAMLWSAFDAWATDAAVVERTPARLRLLAFVAGANAFALLVWGALMAGHHAGLVFSDFPMMGGRVVPSGAFANGSLGGAAVGDAITVHFIHRMLAFALVALAGALVVVSRSAPVAPTTRRWALVVLAAVLVQLALGAATVMTHVPLALASAHQAGALFVVFALTGLVRRTSAGPAL